MSLQRKIIKRQNSGRMLKCQFAARRYFNAAEIGYIAAMGCSILSGFMILIPNTGDVLVERLSVACPVVLDILAWGLTWFAGYCVKNGALLRNYFDRVVFGFNLGDDYDERKIWELVDKIVKRNKKDCELRISHTARDIPSGVKEWYEFSRKYSDSEVVLECQKQNQWWTKKMADARVVAYGSVFLAIIFVFAVLCGLGVEVFRVMFCLLGLTLVFLDRLVYSVKYRVSLLRVDGSLEILGSSGEVRQVEKIQSAIEARRRMPVLEMNIIHEKRSRNFSRQYEGISKK